MSQFPVSWDIDTSDHTSIINFFDKVKNQQLIRSDVYGKETNKFILYGKNSNKTTYKIRKLGNTVNIYEYVDNVDNNEIDDKSHTLLPYISTLKKEIKYDGQIKNVVIKDENDNILLISKDFFDNKNIVKRDADGKIIRDADGKIIFKENFKEYNSNNIFGGGRKASIKKEVCGKLRCIYKIPGSRKEHLKYKGQLITVADYKKLMKAKSI
jgi:hypothetical protein